MCSKGCIGFAFPDQLAIVFSIAAIEAEVNRAHARPQQAVAVVASSTSNLMQSALDLVIGMQGSAVTVRATGLT